jgi:hypothetical protein
MNPSVSITNDDMLRLRIPTHSVTQSVYRINSTNTHFIDVCGLQNHRKVWVKYFDDVHTILFVVSLSSYDQFLAEDPSTNRLVDALVLFDEIVNTEALKAKDVILFLNKKDIFDKKAKITSIKPYFPEYSGFNICNIKIMIFQYLKLLHLLNRSLNVCLEMKGM